MRFRGAQTAREQSLESKLAAAELKRAKGVQSKLDRDATQTRRTALLLVSLSVSVHNWAS